MRVMVAGATGSLGRHVLHVLQRRDHCTGYGTRFKADTYSPSCKRIRLSRSRLSRIGGLQRRHRLNLYTQRCTPFPKPLKPKPQQKRTWHWGLY